MAFEAMIGGVAWGSTGQHKLGKAALALRSMKPGQEHLPHRCLTRHTRLLPVSDKPPTGVKWVVNEAEGTAKWMPHALGRSYADLATAPGGQPYKDVVALAVEAHNAYSATVDDEINLNAGDVEH